MDSNGVIPHTNVIYSGPVDFSKAIQHKNLENKTFVITGGASGLGAAFSKIWAKDGANIIIGDRNTKLGTELVAQLRHETGNSNHHFVSLDVTDWKSQADFFKKASTLSPHGGIDTVVANAGICDSSECAVFENPPDYQSIDNPPAPKLKTMDVNLYGVMYTTTLALSYLSRNPNSQNCSPKTNHLPRDRHLLLTSSIAGVAALSSQSIYCSSKHGVVGVFRALRTTAPISHGVRINMINPYFVDTPILGIAGPLPLAGVAMTKIEDVVEAATRLVTDQSIIGRGLIIGAKGTPKQLRDAGFEEEVIAKDGTAIWDLYAHDFGHSDLVTRRVIAVTNLITIGRGWIGFFSDLVTMILRLPGNLLRG